MRKRLLLTSLAMLALCLVVVPLALAGNGNGNGNGNSGGGTGRLNCPTLSSVNNNKYGLKVSTTVTCTIVGATDVSGSTTVPVYIKSSTLGNTTVTGTVSGTTITFTFTAPANGCSTVVVAYGSTGNNTKSPFGSGNAGGFAFLNSSGTAITCGTPPPDTTPPSCKQTATILGPPKQIQVEVEDSGSGLASVTPTVSNATYTVQSFTRGDTGTVLVTATKTNQSLGATLKLVVIDVAGNRMVCDPIIPAQRVLKLFGTTARALAGLPYGLTTLLVRNGAHSGSVVVRVNGHAIRIGGLRAHQLRRVDIARWMLPGRHNRIVVRQLGHARHSTLVIV